MRNSLIWGGNRRLLPPEFYLDHPSLIASALLGKVLVHSTTAGIMAVRITETEAYAADDPASHSFKGRTDRNHSMFSAGGCLYIYLIYGIHQCLNIVSEAEGTGSAVLIRAGEPLEGMDLMWVNRFPGDALPGGGLSGNSEHSPGIHTSRERKKLKMLTSGPGNLCRAMGFSREKHDGLRLSAGEDLAAETFAASRAGSGAVFSSAKDAVFLMDDGNNPPLDSISASRRIGITKGVDTLWRFSI